MPEIEVLGARYEVLRTVSEGRRASVLQGLDRVHDRLVALKVYPVGDEDRDKLLAEARLLMSVAPNPALPVIRGDFFTDDGRYVLVMNWVDGIDLQQALEEEGDPGLSLHDVLRHVADAATALDHLHSHEPPIVHGDVKPSNLVRTASGSVVLVDFDIAGAHAGDGRLGTVGYVAPEVMAGEKPGPAADVFGLAATAVALINGVSQAEATPTYPGIDPAERNHVARVLRAALAVDPIKRPASAGRLVENLRGTERHDPPSGPVALLATEVADAGRYWDEEPEEMRVAMSRLRDVASDVIDEGRGHVVTSMNEGDRTIAVFRDVSAAATAALLLHDRLDEEHFPPGISVRLRAAIVVGETTLVDGVFTGAVVDQVVQLRSKATPGTTVTSESTAERLLGLVGADASIVPLEGTTPQIFALTRPGAERTARLRSAPSSVPPPPPVAATVGRPRRTIVIDALQHPSALVSLVVAGLSLIYLAVLSSDLGMTGFATITLVLGTFAAVVSFARNYSIGYAAWRDEIAAQRQEVDREATAREVARERSETRERLEYGYGRLGSAHGREGSDVLYGLADEFDAITDLLRRGRSRASISESTLLPDLADETYRYGMSALSDALELFEFAEGPQQRRLVTELADVEERLVLDEYSDTRARERDEQRFASHQQLLAHHQDTRERACELMFEAERCTAALADTRIELSSVRAGDTRLDVDAVVQTLQETIRRVRDVQNEMRRMGY